MPKNFERRERRIAWLFLIMINNLNAGGEADMWKCVDDTTIYEVIDKGQESCIQQVVDDLAMKARDDGFQLNERKCKELRISFAGTNQNLTLSGLTVRPSRL